MVSFFGVLNSSNNNTSMLHSLNILLNLLMYFKGLRKTAQITYIPPVVRVTWFILYLRLTDAGE
jgi:hypothetical protein